ncbi:tetratricopeptide repeat protein [Pseudoalteromonas mariniglutinosa]|uniref:tetratricopeptide repeat protein n=1 Tax=Pseudoalteromonas mariniglutinosa TaxID=206042 RepID=UPI00384D9C5A
MLALLKRILLFSCLMLWSFFCSVSVNAEPSLFTQFSNTQQWATKNQLAERLINHPSLTNKQRVEIHLQLAELALSLGDYTNALENYQSVEQFSNTEADHKRYFNAVKMQGVVYFYQGLLQQAVVEYNRALQLIEKMAEPLQQANLLSNIGLAYFNMFNMDLALDNYQKAKKIYQQVGSAQDKADILHNIAGIYIRSSNYDTALALYREVLEVFQQLGDEDGVAQSYGNMGVAYAELGQYQLALHYYHRALRYYQSTNDVYLLSSHHSNIANIQLKLDAIALALNHAEQAIDFARQINNKALELAALQILAKIQIAQGNITTAQSTLERSMMLAQQYNDQLRVHDGIGLSALLSASLGDYKGALELHDEYIRMQRTQTSEKQLKALSVLQSQMQASQLNQEINELKQQSRLQEVEMSKQSQLSMMLLIVFLLLAITGVALYRRHVEKHAKLQLSEKVLQRTQELEDTAQALRAANDVKSQFLANVSHEIRTPLTAILGHTDDLINGLYQPEQLNDELKIIQKHSDHLKDLINDVLDISKIEANKLELNLSVFDLVSLANDVQSMLTVQAKNKGLNFSSNNQLGDQFYCKLDFTRVKQVLINLCSNAIKFTERGEVSVEIKHADNGVVFSVKDTGIGMDPEQLKIIFECFRQGDNGISRRFGGTGLGLSLSQQLAIMMGGYISVASESNKGSVFSFYLPCRQLSNDNVNNVADGTVLNINSCLAGKVLLAEDHYDNRRLITRYLESIGLDVIAVENGEQAVEACLKEFPDVVLLDIQMPVLDGLSAFQLLVECGFSQPVYALTANAMSDEVERYLKAGFTGYLSKPIDKSVFYTQLAKHCRSLHAKSVTEQFDMSDLVASFIASFEQESALIKQHFAMRQFDDLQQDAHRLLGAARMFSLELVADRAMNLERALKCKEYDQLTELVMQLLTELNTAKTRQQCD